MIRYHKSRMNLRQFLLYKFIFYIFYISQYLTYFSFYFILYLLSKNIDEYEHLQTPRRI